MSYYKEVIGILTQDNIDWKAICREIATTNPSVIVKACRMLGYTDGRSWTHEVRSLWIDQGNKLAAIKLYRNHTGCSLKDAKEAIEAMR